MIQLQRDEWFDRLKSTVEKIQYNIVVLFYLNILKKKKQLNGCALSEVNNFFNVHKK